MAKPQRDTGLLRQSDDDISYYSRQRLTQSTTDDCARRWPASDTAASALFVLGKGDRRDAEEVHLVIFDRTPGQSWEERLWQRTESYRNVSITVWGM